MSELIDMRSKWWYTNVIGSVFFAHEVETILKIPLSPQLPKNKVKWAETKSREFTVKNAYLVARRQLQNSNTRESSNLGARKMFWKSLWNMNVPNKIKTFAWRVCKNIIPTKVNLERRI